MSVCVRCSFHVNIVKCVVQPLFYSLDTSDWMTIVVVNLNARTPPPFPHSRYSPSPPSTLTLLGPASNAHPCASPSPFFFCGGGVGVLFSAGPAKTPEGLASGSFGPTTAGRMDGYVDSFMKNGGSFVTLAKGNRWISWYWSWWFR